LVGGGFSSGKSDRSGASFSPTSLTSPRACAAARAATTEGEEKDLKRERRRRPRRLGAALDDDDDDDQVVDDAAFREVEGAACTPRMLMARILIGW
jgi:hypothetical protein